MDIKWHYKWFISICWQKEI